MNRYVKWGLIALGCVCLGAVLVPYLMFLFIVWVLDDRGFE